MRQESAELYQALRTMTWRAKSTLLASDQGLKELTESFSSTSKTLKPSIFTSLIFSCIIFSTVSALLFLINVESVTIKLSVAVGCFVGTFMCSISYFVYYQKRGRILNAV